MLLNPPITAAEGAFAGCSSRRIVDVALPTDVIATAKFLYFPAWVK